jgi:serine/threonine-protein kinase
MACSDERLLELLQQDDHAEAPAEIAHHLDGCEYCRARLEALAAEPAEWEHARETLTSAATDAAGDFNTRNHRTGAWKIWNLPTSSVDSMVRQVLAEPSHPEMLGRIGRYDVERVIGAGGMGIVFKAFDTELNRPVAIKVLAPNLAGNGSARQRFAREARAAAAVVHEHVVAIHNVETGGPAPFLVMPFVAGESLQQRIDRQGPLGLKEILRISMQTAAGLAAAHAQGLVHRDVKPSNILLEDGVERALLTDFGLAQANDDASLTHTGFHPGTPQYMSPEQARGDAVDARSDLFSLGSVMYAMAAGRTPFRAETSLAVLRRITDTEPRPIREINPELPDWLGRLIACLHAKSPARRFSSAGELAATLEQCLAHVQHPASTRLPDVCRAAMNFPARWMGQRWKTTVLSAVVLLAAGMTFAVLTARVPSETKSGLAPNQSPVRGNVDTNGGATNSSSPSIDWDHSATEIQSFAEDFAREASRMEQLWDKEPLPFQGVRP